MLCIIKREMKFCIFSATGLWQILCSCNFSLKSTSMIVCFCVCVASSHKDQLSEWVVLNINIYIWNTFFWHLQTFLLQLLFWSIFCILVPWCSPFPQTLKMLTLSQSLCLCAVMKMKTTNCLISDNNLLLSPIIMHCSDWLWTSWSSS